MQYRAKSTFIYVLAIAMLNMGFQPLLQAQEMNLEHIQRYTQSTDSYWIKGMQLLNKDSVFVREYDKRYLIGDLLSRNGDAQAGIYWYRYALTSPYITHNDSVSIFHRLAICYEITGRLEEAMKVLLQCLAKQKDSTDINETYLMIGNIYIQFNHLDKARAIIEQAMTYFHDHKDTMRVLMAVRSKNFIFKKQKKYDSSLKYSIQSCQLGKKIIENPRAFEVDILDAQKVYYLVLNDVADAYIHLNEPDSALLYLHKIGLKTIEKLNNVYYQAIIYTSFGEAYALKKDISASLQYFEKALALQSNTSQSYEIRLETYKALSKLYAQAGQYQKAWHYEHESFKLYEVIVSEENINKAQQLQNQYSMELKDKELAQKTLSLKNNELKLKQRKYQIYLLILLMGSAVAIILFVVRNYRMRQKLAKAQILNLEKENRISMIAATSLGEETERERIARELHDSVVSEATILKLNVLRLGKLAQGIDHYAEYNTILFQSDNIKNRIRQVAHDLMPLNLQKLGLHQAILSYIDRISAGNLSFHFQSVGETIVLTEQKEKILFMILQELMQNIIKHSHATAAMIQLNYFEECVTLTAEDNGVGLQQNAREQEGMGMTNIRHYVNTLNGHIDISSSEYTGTTVLIELPYSNILFPIWNPEFP